MLFGYKVARHCSAPLAQKALARCRRFAISSKLSSAANKIVNKAQSVLFSRFGDKLISFDIQSIELIPSSGSITVTIPAEAIKLDVHVSGTGGEASGEGKNEDPIKFDILLD